MPERVVLVLGCGIGGVVAAREARRLLPDSYRIIAIDKEPDASFPPSYLWVMTGERRPNAISRKRAQLARRGIEFVNAEVRQIDLENRYVRADSREFHYDYLIIALGADTSLDTKPGLAESAHTFYTLDGAERLAATLRYFAGGRVLITVAGLPFKCPPAPYEAAMLLENYFLQRHMRQKVEIEVYTPEVTPLAITGREHAEEVMGLLAHKGVELHTETRLEGVDTTRHEAVFDNGERVPFQLLIAVPEHRAPVVVQEAGLIDESGWITVNPRTLQTAHENVYAIGDITSIQLPDGVSLPKAGVFAEGQAKAVARQIAFRETGGPTPDPFDGEGRCFLETGGGAAGLAEGNFYEFPRQIKLRQPSIVWHWGKKAFEKYWLWRWMR